MIAAVLLASALRFTANAHHAVTTVSAQAQTAFDRGLTMLYSYNGDAANAAFARALQIDPHLAMAAWGEALASGTDLNTGLDEQRFARAHAAAAQAQSLESYASPEERLYVDAVAVRYAGSYDDRDTDEARYRDAMARLVAAYPLDDDAAALDAEAIMEQLGTDRLWTSGGTQPVAQTRVALARIDTVLARDPNHLMANHLCMHAYDYANDRTPAIACADRIASWSFAPAQEHLAHMPAHTYIEVGAYAKAVAVSEAAWTLRERWNAQPDPPFPLRYAKHDAYTGWSAAMMLGNEDLAQRWAQRVGAAYDGSDLWITWARFGQWQRIEDANGTNEFYAPLARGLADVHLGRLADARTMLAAYANVDADYHYLLQGALSEHDGDIPAAVAALDQAIADQARDDGAEQIPLLPAGEALGALYYRHGRYAEARDAFFATLKRYPQDPRALYGLALTEKALGQAVSSAQTLKTFAAIWTEPRPPDLGDF